MRQLLPMSCDKTDTLQCCNARSVCGEVSLLADPCTPCCRTFALSNNLADVTAKGESVANLADVLGTIFGILVSKARAPVLPTFCFLSAGYLISSRREVDAVELPYLNRARLAYTVARYLQTGGWQLARHPLAQCFLTCCSCW
jgi:hypothetical protein